MSSRPPVGNQSHPNQARGTDLSKPWLNWGGLTWTDLNALIGWMNARGEQTNLTEFLHEHPGVAGRFHIPVEQDHTGLRAGPTPPRDTPQPPAPPPSTGMPNFTPDLSNYQNIIGQIQTPQPPSLVETLRRRTQPQQQPVVGAHPPRRRPPQGQLRAAQRY